MIRKTRLMSKAGVMLVRVEVSEGPALRLSHFRMNTPAAVETFADLAAALEAFRIRTSQPLERAPLKAA